VILIDTNILVDLVVYDPVWSEWSERELAIAKARDELAINAIVYAEVSVGYTRIDDVDELLRATGITLTPIPRGAMFLAGKAFQRYRTAGGIRTGVLPDFFLGAHAQVTDSLLLTRDISRYRTYFPAVELISPEV
jgi:predicted nucleic acid-binding protein